MRRIYSKNILWSVFTLIALVMICCGCSQQASEPAHMVKIRSLFGADLPEVTAALGYSEGDFSYSEELGSYVLTAPVEVLERNATLQLHFLERREGKALQGATFEIVSSAAPADGATDAIRFCNRLKEIYAEPYQGLVKSEKAPELGSIDQQTLTKIFSENGKYLPCGS